MGTRFKVVTDHNTLKALPVRDSLKGWLAYWAYYLMGFDMDIVYCQGRYNNIFCTLSKLMFN